MHFSTEYFWHWIIFPWEKMCVCQSPGAAAKCLWRRNACVACGMVLTLQRILNFFVRVLVSPGFFSLRRDMFLPVSVLFAMVFTATENSAFFIGILVTSDFFFLEKRLALDSLPENVCHVVMIFVLVSCQTHCLGSSCAVATSLQTTLLHCRVLSIFLAMWCQYPLVGAALDALQVWHEESPHVGPKSWGQGTIGCR